MTQVTCCLPSISFSCPSSHAFSSPSNAYASCTTQAEVRCTTCNPSAPTCPQHECHVPHRPGNVYGDDQHPVEQVKEIERKSCWHDIIREPRLSHQLESQMPGNLPSTPIAPPAHTPTPPTTSDSKDDVEWLCHEGGADLAAFLMSKAIPI